MYSHSFEKLNVWRESIGLVEMIYKMTEQFPQDGKFGTVSQIGRGSISIASNLAEGTSRSTGGGG